VKLTLRDLDKLTLVESRHRELLKGKAITGVSTDSRKVNPGAIFVALKGENFDGHQFVEDTFRKGAIAAIVDELFVGVSDKPLFIVKDTTFALGELARIYRMKFDIPVLAIGGSNGKTTTKDMTTAVLSTSYKVLGTDGNLNNHIGVPQTLLRLETKHQMAVVEIGTNHPGEIEYLCRILQPTHGLLTNIGKEHLEFFESLEGVALEEGSLFSHLRKKKKSVAFVNADDLRIRLKARGIRRRITYGISAKQVDVRGKVGRTNESGCITFEYASRRPVKRGAIQLEIPGEHNALNALAAATVGLTFKVPANRIKKALESLRPTVKRMELLNCGGVSIYNDTYNANPDSMVAALRTLASARVSGKRIAVLGDMRELGVQGKEEHSLVGREAAQLGIDYVLTFGELARSIHEAANMQGALHYDQKNMLAEYLAELVSPGDAVLVKGSRGMKMEDIVTFLEKRLSSAVVSHG
jgi:UDP-N-acetylmuramoyl-tripeptide--D-alanyl-D-alanine ligase